MEFLVYPNLVLEFCFISMLIKSRTMLNRIIITTEKNLMRQWKRCTKFIKWLVTRWTSDCTVIPVLVWITCYSTPSKRWEPSIAEKKPQNDFVDDLWLLVQCNFSFSLAISTKSDNLHRNFSVHFGCTTFILNYKRNEFVALAVFCRTVNMR